MISPLSSSWATRTNLQCEWSFPSFRRVFTEAYDRYKVGESFLHIPHNRALKRLEGDKSSLDSQISGLSDQIEECEKEMQKLKTVLYAKFGSAINLDE